MVQNPPANTGWLPGSGRFPGEGNDNPLRILAWAIPWMEEPGWLQSMDSQRVGHTWARTHTHRVYFPPDSQRELLKTLERSWCISAQNPQWPQSHFEYSRDWQCPQDPTDSGPATALILALGSFPLLLCGCSENMASLLLTTVFASTQVPSSWNPLASEWCGLER